VKEEEPVRRSTRQTTHWTEASERKSKFGISERTFYTKVEEIDPYTNDDKFLGFFTSVDKFMKVKPEETTNAVREEVSQLLEMDVFEPVDPSTLTNDDWKNVMPAVTFMKEKVKPNGEYDKMKARAAAGAHVLSDNIVAQMPKASPTADMTSVFILLILAAVLCMITSVVDVKGAFLNSIMPPDIKAYLKLDKFMTSVLLTLPNTERFKKYVRPDGTLIVRLKKALYGHPMASKLWYENIAATLMNAGYQRLIHDKCIFIMRDDNNNIKSMLSIHVDDIFHACTDVKTKVWLEKLLISTYKEITVSDGETLNYLGMVLTFNKKEGYVELSQPKYIDDLLKLYNIQPDCIAPNPATSKLFNNARNNNDNNVNNNNNNNNNINNNNKEFASLVMRLMYLAKRTRPDILLPVSYLATRMTQPMDGDMKSLLRVLKFINNTKHDKLKLSCDINNINIICYVDAAYDVHYNSLGHSGCVIYLSNPGGPIYFKSTKQKLVSRSSTEAELNAVYDNLPQCIWLKGLLTEILNKDDVNIIIYQDNKSTIELMNKGQYLIGKAKHQILRYNYINQQLKENRISINYIGTEDMIADIYTKPLEGTQFIYLRSKLLNNT
jgi:hypothetical protein